MEEQWNTLSVHRLGQSGTKGAWQFEPVMPAALGNTRSRFSTPGKQSLGLKNTLVRPGLRVLTQACIVTVSHPQPFASMTLVRSYDRLIEGERAEPMPVQWASLAC
jgi:hypothetical protein